MVESLWQALCAVEIRGLHPSIRIAWFLHHSRMSWDRSPRTFSWGLPYFLLHAGKFGSIMLQYYFMTASFRTHFSVHSRPADSHSLVAMGTVLLRGAYADGAAPVSGITSPAQHNDYSSAKRASYALALLHGC